MLRASEVTAELRLISLLRGRLEISRLDLTEPSLNLVHGEAGAGTWRRCWNVRRNSTGADGEAEVGRRPAFPYIEATSGRINFKSGPGEKTLRADERRFLVVAGFREHLGNAAESAALPHRLEFERHGLLLIRGRGSGRNVARHPLDFNVSGAAHNSASSQNFSPGTTRLAGRNPAGPGDFGHSGETEDQQQLFDRRLSPLRHYQWQGASPGSALRRRVQRCTHDFQEVLCSAPIGNGLITLTGDAGFPGSHEYSLAASAHDIPAAPLVSLAQRIQDLFSG